MTKGNYRPAIRKKTCRYCGEDFYAKRSDAQFCTASCKQKNHLEKKSAAIFMETVKFQMMADKEKSQKRKKAFLDQVEYGLNQINDPDKHDKFQKLLAEQMMLVATKTNIEDIFLLEQHKQVPFNKLKLLIKKIGSDFAILQEKNRFKHGFIIEINEKILKFSEYLASEYELTRKNAINIKIPSDLREYLIKGHAKIKKMIE